MSKPNVGVLLATHNGSRWIDRQIDTVLAQCDVNLRIFVSDDSSTDDTVAHLRILASSEPRITILPTSEKVLGSASANFQRLIREVGDKDFQYFAFCDQDDEWESERLALAIKRLCLENADGFSSSVTAFWPDGRESLIYNASRPTRIDYFGITAGQGCSFVLSRRALEWVRQVMVSQEVACQTIHYHDWLTYALIRAKGWNWVYYPESTLRYRQHFRNEIGARVGFSGVRTRHNRIVSGWYARQLQCVAEIVEKACPGHPEAREVLAMLSADSFTSRVAKMPTALEMRRRPLDRLAFMGYFLAGYLHSRDLG
jgi:rhamnosyltransferase